MRTYWLSCDCTVLLSTPSLAKRTTTYFLAGKAWPCAGAFYGLETESMGSGVITRIRGFLNVFVYLSEPACSLIGCFSILSEEAGVVFLPSPPEQIFC